MCDSRGNDKDPQASEPADEETKSEADSGAPKPPTASPTAPPPPPHPLDKQWQISVDGKTYGPYTGHQLRAYIDEGRVTRDTTVALPGTHVWQKASADKILGPLFDKVETPASQARAHSGGTAAQNSGIMSASASIGLEPGLKSPGIALILSLLMCGVGQMYNGEVAKGIMMFIGNVVLVIFWLAMGFPWFGWVIWIWSMIDAYKGAESINAAHRAYLKRQASRRST